jgi:hypothetical protein
MTVTRYRSNGCSMIDCLWWLERNIPWLLASRLRWTTQPFINGCYRR